MKKILRTVPGLTNVGDDYDPARPQIRIDVDRSQAKVLGFTTSDVALAVRGSIYGTEAAKYRVGKEEYKIMVRLAPDVREDINGFNRIMVSHEGTKAPLTSVATITQSADIASIRHVDAKRTVQVWAELAPGPERRRETQGKWQWQRLRKLHRRQVTALCREAAIAIRPSPQQFLVMAFFIAISLIFLIMVFQFNSLFQPVLILIGILLSVGGVFWGLLITNKFNEFVNLITFNAAHFPTITFSIMFSGIGIIALAGVVAKNGIVLIDFMNKLRKEGKPLHEAVIEGGATRLRPVLLTAITAMIGLLPIATGVGIDFLHLGFVTRSESTQWWAPMAMGNILGSVV